MTSADAQAAKQLDRVAGRLARAIGEGDDADRPSVARDEHGGVAAGAQLVEPLVNRRRANPALLEHAMIAEQHACAADRAFRAASGERRHAFGRRGRDAGGRRVLDDRERDRMVRSLLDRRRQRDDRTGCSPR